MIQAWTLFLSILLLTMTSFAQIPQRVIYGEDNRKDLFEVTDDDLILKSRATAAALEIQNLEEQPDKSYKIKSQNYGKAYGLCPDERFFDQEKAAFCSSFLITEDLLVTAGHCVQSAFDCAKTAFVFDFSYQKQGRHPNDQPADNVYFCKELVHSVYTSTTDFALVRLDRKVINRSPLEVRESGEVPLETEVIAIGHPSGLPTKITDKGSIRSNTNPIYFNTNLDTYAGNSGSVILNASTGLVEGLLVRGARDFVSVGGCLISNVCKDKGCRGEDVTRISEVLSFMEQI